MNWRSKRAIKTNGIDFELCFYSIGLHRSYQRTQYGTQATSKRNTEPKRRKGFKNPMKKNPKDNLFYAFWFFKSILLVLFHCIFECFLLLFFLDRILKFRFQKSKRTQKKKKHLKNQ